MTTASNKTQYRNSVKFMRIAMFIHKWAGLLLALQIFFWIAGGLIMSAIPLDKVHGKHLANRDAIDSQPVTPHISLDKLIERHPTLESIQFSRRLSHPTITITDANNSTVYHARTGEVMSELTHQEVVSLAEHYYTGDGTLVTAHLIAQPPHEASRLEQPVWQVDYDDLWRTTLYIDPQSGALHRVRSDIWRVFDFVWMLHIMDYDERSDFNNPLLIIAASLALLFTFSGIILLYRSFKPAFQKRIKSAATVK